MATLDDFDEDEEHANVALITDVCYDSKNESIDEKIEVLSDISHNELISILMSF